MTPASSGPRPRGKAGAALVATALVAGALGAAGDRLLGSSREPAWAHDLRARADNQARLLDEQGRAVDLLARAVGGLSASRSGAETCLTLSALRGELEAHSKEALGGTAPQDSGANAPPPSEPARRAADAAATLLERATAAGAWSEDDVAQLRQNLPAMTAEQRDRVMSSLFQALNDGRLKLTARAPM